MEYGTIERTIHTEAGYNGPESLSVGNWRMVLDYSGEPIASFLKSAIKDQYSLWFLGGWDSPEDQSTKLQGLIENSMTDSLYSAVNHINSHGNMVVKNWEIVWQDIEWTDEEYGIGFRVRVPNAVFINFEVMENPIVAVVLIIAVATIIAASIEVTPGETAIEKVGSGISNIFEEPASVARTGILVAGVVLGFYLLYRYS